MADVNMRILLSAIGGAGVISSVNQVASAFKNNLGAGLVAAGAVAAAALVGVGVASVNMAASYQQSMNKVQALTGSSNQQMQQYDTALKNLATNAGVAPQALSEGLYNVISAGYSGSAAMNVLTLSTEDSKIGMTDAATTANALTNVMANFKVAASGANIVNGEMLQTVTMGKATFSQYASNITKAASTSAQYGQSMETMNAAWATLTASGISAGMATTDYDQSLKMMNGSIGTVVKSLHSNGIAFDQTKFESMSYGQQVVYMNDALQQARDKHVAITGATAQASQAISTIAGHISMYNNDLGALSDKQAMADKTQQAWSTTQQGFSQQMSRLNAAGQVLLITIGSQLLPVLTNIVAAITPVVVSITNWLVSSHVLQNTINGVGDVIKFVVPIIGNIISSIVNWENRTHTIQNTLHTLGTIIHDVGTFIQQQAIPAIKNIVSQVETWNQKTQPLHTALNALHDAVQAVKNIIDGTISTITNIVNWFTKWRTPILSVSGAITGFFLPAMIKAGVEATINGVKITASFISSLAKTGTAAVINGAKTTAQFVTSMIKSGTEAVVNGAKVTASFVTSMIKSGTEAVVNGAKVTGSFVASLIKTGLEGWQAAGKLATFIGSMIASGAAAVANAAKVTASFVASMITAGIQAVMSAAKIVGSFVASLITTGIQAAISGGIMLASLVPALLATAGAALLAAAPFILVGLVVAAVVVGIVLAVQHWGQITTWLRGVWSGFSSWISGVLNRIGGFFTSVFNHIHSFIQSAMSVIVNILKVAGMALFVALTGPIGLIVLYVATHWQQVKNDTQTALTDAKTIISNIGNDIKNIWNNLLSSITSIVTNLWSRVSDQFNNAKNTLGNIVSGIGSHIMSILNNLPGQALQAGETIINNLASGIRNAIGKVTGAISDVTAAIGKFLPHSPAEQGELSHLNEYGPNLVNGFAQGIINNRSTLMNAMNSLTQTGAALRTPAIGSSAANGTSSTGVGVPPLSTIAGGSIAGGSGSTTVVNFSPQMTLQGLDDASLEQAAQKMEVLMANILRGQFGNL
jgi:TP901 family phage tail tape measure protein